MKIMTLSYKVIDCWKW